MALLALKFPPSAFTWYEGRFLSAYHHTMASEMLELGADPDTLPAQCVPLLTVCQMPAEERAQALQFLQRHELNIYSADFVEHYRLQKLVRPDPTAVE